MKVYFVIISKIVLKTGRGISLLGKEKKSYFDLFFLYPGWFRLSEILRPASYQLVILMHILCSISILYLPMLAFSI